MDQIRARIADKRGVDYTEAQIRELASVSLSLFLDSDKIRSDLVEQYQRRQSSGQGRFEMPPPIFTLPDETIYASPANRRGRLVKMCRRFLRPVLRLLFNPDTIIEGFRSLNEHADYHARQITERQAIDALYFELLNNLVVTITRQAIDIKNLQMRLESVVGRLDLDERRTRALESVVQYRPGTSDPSGTPHAAGAPGEQESTSRARQRQERRQRLRPDKPKPTLE